MKESIWAWKNTCHVLMHTQRLIPLKLWYVSLSVYHNSVKSSVWQSAAMQLSHLTHWTLHEIHLEVQVIGCLQAGQGLWRHSEEWMWMRRLPVAAAPKPSETFTGLVLNAVKNFHIAGVLTSYVQKQWLFGADTFSQREAGRVSPPGSKSFHLWPLSQHTSWESSPVSCVALCSSQSWRD